MSPIQKVVSTLACLYKFGSTWGVDVKMGHVLQNYHHFGLRDKIGFAKQKYIHSDKKILIQNVKTFSSGTNAQTVWLGVYKYSD